MKDSFTIAESFDEQNNRYRGMQPTRNITLNDPYSPSILVKPDVALRQIKSEEELIGLSPSESGEKHGNANSAEPRSDSSEASASIVQPKRFHGSVSLDPARVGRDASQIADEAIVHLVGLVGAKVTVTLEIEANIPDGVPDNIIRTVTENGRTLKFSSQGFETE